MKNTNNPKKHLGQVFLKEKSIANLAAKSLAIKKQDIVLEIGPGKGILTKAVLNLKPKKLIIIEKDKDLEDFLKEKFKASNLEIIFKDIREIDLDSFLKENKITKVISNLPYYISGYFLRQVLDLKYFPEIIVLMLQKEVSQKILAKKSSFFSVAFGAFFKKEKIKTIKPGSFYPKPKVESEIIRLSKITPKIPLSKKQDFFKLLNLAFKQSRKTLFSNLKLKHQNNLKNIFNKLGLDLKIRAHQLSLNDWLKLFKELEK